MSGPYNWREGCISCLAGVCWYAIAQPAFDDKVLPWPCALPPPVPLQLLDVGMHPATNLCTEVLVLPCRSGADPAVQPWLLAGLQGLQYRLGDFSVGLARAVQRPLGELRGVIVEVAYHPLSTLRDAEPVLQVGCWGGVGWVGNEGPVSWGGDVWIWVVGSVGEGVPVGRPGTREASYELACLPECCAPRQLSSSFGDEACNRIGSAGSLPSWTHRVGYLVCAAGLLRGAARGGSRNRRHTAGGHCGAGGVPFARAVLLPACGGAARAAHGATVGAVRGYGGRWYCSCAGSPLCKCQASESCRSGSSTCIPCQRR